MNAATDNRQATRVAVHRLLTDSQVDLSTEPPDVRALARQGDEYGWPEVSVMARYVAVVGTRIRGEEHPQALIDTMWRRAEHADDPALAALALGCRSRLLADSGDAERLLLADTDLASAVVLLEQHAGGSLERIVAHIECGVALGHRSFWELERAQYDAALAIVPEAVDPGLAAFPEITVPCRWAPLYNLVDLETRWAAASRVAGDQRDQQAHAAAAVAAFDQAVAGSLPEPWIEELRLTLLLPLALLGHDVAQQAAAAASAGGVAREAAGAALTARAVSLAGHDPPAARRAAEAAITMFADARDPTPVELAMFIAADVEGSAAGRRFGYDQARRRWDEHQLSLNAMKASLRSERFRARSEELDRHAHYDELTGLANRRGLNRYLSDLSRSDNPTVAVLAVDVDRFKHINDTLGHRGGDEALDLLASVLRSLVRPSDMVARLGGDEFVVVLDGMGSSDALQRAQRIVEAVRRSWRAAERGVSCSVSIGVASGDRRDIARLLVDADHALYQAKSAGGNRSSAGAPARPEVDPRSE